PNLRYELDRFCARTGGRVSFNKEALRRFLGFASSSGASWSANFRDLGGAVTRMATLAPGGRITEEVVAEEVERLGAAWHRADAVTEKTQSDAAILEDALGKAGAQELDAFDRVQLAEVLRVCRTTSNLSEAGRVLFAVSREKKKTTNDADRVRKYLMRFGVDYDALRRVG
ncbi:TPA: transcriptional regulator, partial [Candidatus Sumerlaeota bacterium]|nr:transcriptional regulator [Candidatus Sumerlaeota bacterium]